jgi:hypothetical protein
LIHPDAGWEKKVVIAWAEYVALGPDPKDKEYIIVQNSLQELRKRMKL